MMCYRIGLQLGNGIAVVFQFLSVLIHQNPVTFIRVESVIGRIQVVQAFQSDGIHIQILAGGQIILHDVFRGFDFAQRIDRRKAADLTGHSLIHDRKGCPRRRHGRSGCQLTHSVRQESASIISVQAVPIDAVMVGQRGFDHGALLQVLSGIGTKGSQHLRLASCVTAAGIQGVLHNGHGEAQGDRAVVYRGRRRFTGVLLHHDIGVGRQLHGHIVGSGLLFRAGLFFRPAALNGLRGAEGDICADRAEEKIARNANFQTFLKAVGFAAADRAGGRGGGGVGDLLLRADGRIGHVFHLGGICLAARFRFTGSALIEVAAILRQDRGDGNIAEQNTQRLIMALFVIAAGLIRADQHPVDIVWIDVPPQRFILGDGLIGLSGAAGTLVPLVYRSLHSFRGICHGGGIVKPVGADIIGVASGVCAPGIAILEIVVLQVATIGQSGVDRSVKLRFEVTVACTSAVGLLNEVSQILPLCRCGLVIATNVCGQHILDKQLGARIKEVTIHLKILNTVDYIRIGDGIGISRKCRCGQQAQDHNESKQAAE